MTNGVNFLPQKIIPKSDDLISEGLSNTPYRPCQHHPDSRFAYLWVIFGMQQGLDVVLRMVKGVV